MRLTVPVRSREAGWHLNGGHEPTPTRVRQLLLGRLGEGGVKEVRSLQDGPPLLA